MDGEGREMLQEGKALSAELTPLSDKKAFFEVLYRKIEIPSYILRGLESALIK